MQDDGNLVIYDVYNDPIWASGTQYKGQPPYKLVLLPDQNLVVLDKKGERTWETSVW